MYYISTRASVCPGLLQKNALESVVYLPLLSDPWTTAPVVWTKSGDRIEEQQVHS